MVVVAVGQIDGRRFRAVLIEPGHDPSGAVGRINDQALAGVFILHKVGIGREHSQLQIVY